MNEVICERCNFAEPCPNYPNTVICHILQARGDFSLVYADADHKPCELPEMWTEVKNG